MIYTLHICRECEAHQRSLQKLIAEFNCSLHVHFTYLVKIGFFKTFQSLNPGRAIAEIKKLLAGIAEKGNPGLEGTAGEDFFI